MTLFRDWNAERLDEQFAEDDDERRERWRRTKQKRRDAGLCWQCAKPLTGGQCQQSGCGAKQ